MSEDSSVEEEMAYAFIDLDGFSEINNEHGHSFGDEVLEQIVDFGEEFVDDRGEFSREYGQGDEFLIKLPGYNKDEAKEMMEMFREQLAELEPNGVNVTASIGIARLPDDGDDENEVIDEADQAMLNAETWGGDIVRVAGREVPTKEFEVWFEDFLRVDEGDYVTLQMWLDGLPSTRAAEIRNETKDMDNSSHVSGTVMASTKYEEPISGVVTDILGMDSSETRFKMVAERSRLKELELL